METGETREDGIFDRETREEPGEELRQLDGNVQSFKEKIRRWSDEEVGEMVTKR